MSRERAKYAGLVAFANRDVTSLVRQLSKFRPEDVSAKKTRLIASLDKAKENLKSQKAKLEEFDLTEGS